MNTELQLAYNPVLNSVKVLRNEEMVNTLLQKNKTQFVGLRFFTVYGEWGRPDMFVMK